MSDGSLVRIWLDRPNRELRNRFGSHDYAREEVRVLSIRDVDGSPRLPSGMSLQSSCCLTKINTYPPLVDAVAGCGLCE